MRLVIVTGMSGAGKSSALKMLEDAGYFCVDNIPIQLIYKLVILTSGDTKEFDKVALGIDIRSGQSLDELDEVFDEDFDDDTQFNYDLNGILQVNAKVLSTGEEVRKVINRL